MHKKAENLKIASHSSNDDVESQISAILAKAAAASRAQPPAQEDDSSSSSGSDSSDADDNRSETVPSEDDDFGVVGARARSKKLGNNASRRARPKGTTPTRSIPANASSAVSPNPKSMFVRKKSQPFDEEMLGPQSLSSPGGSSGKPNTKRYKGSNIHLIDKGRLLLEEKKASNG